MGQLLFSLMGPFQSVIDHQPGFQLRKVQALLAYMVTEHGRSHTREALALLLWPDYPNPSVLTILRNALANLRHPQARPGKRFF